MITSASSGMLVKPNARAASLLFVFACVGVWLARPLAWIPSGFVSLPHHIDLPVEMVLAMMAIPVAISGRLVPPRWCYVPGAVYLLSLIANWVWFDSHPLPALRLAAFALVPYGLATALQENAKNRERLRLVLAWMWLWHLLLGFWNLAIGQDPIGLAGNRNWSAALILALMPWAWLTFGRKHPRQWRLPIRGAIVLATIIFLVPCEARAAWLALVVVAGLWIAARWSWRERILVSLAVLCAGGIFLLMNPLLVMEKVREDVRLPLTARTIAMTVHNDVIAASAVQLFGGAVVPSPETRALQPPGPAGFAGVGPGSYRRAFAPYRATSTYGERRVAAPSTIHPHNEALLIAAEIGVAAAVCWLIFVLVPILGGLGDRDPQRQVAAVAAMVLFVCSLFDMPLTRRPTSVLFLIVLAASWPRLRQIATRKQSATLVRLRLALTSVFLFVGLATAVALGSRQLRAEYHMRRAYIEENYLDNPGKAYEHYAMASVLAYKPEDPLLFAGTISLRKLDKPEQALLWFDKAREVDPNVGYLNRELGQAYMIQGRAPEAMPFLERHRRLYPHDPEAWYRQFVAAVFSGNLAIAAQIGLQLPPVWLHRFNLEFPDGRLEPAVRNWLSACADPDPEALRAPLDKLTKSLGDGVWDPLTFILLDASGGKPEDLESLPIDELDQQYWQVQLALAQRLPPPAEPTVKALATQLAERLTLVAAGEKIVPDELATEGRVPTTEAVAITLAVGAQWQLAGYQTSWQEQDAALFILPDGSGTIIVPGSDWQVVQAPRKHPAKLALPLAGYRMRNQAAACAAQAVGTPVAAPIPSLELLRLFRWYDTAPPRDELLNYCQPPAEIRAESP